MMLSKTQKGRLALVLCIVIAAAVSYFFCSSFIQPEKSPQDSYLSGDANKTAGYCTVQEVHPDYITNETIVHLKDDDFISFPRVGEGLKNRTDDLGKWYNGHRFVYDFKGPVDNITKLRNLSCRDTAGQKCTPFEFPVVYEYNGRYFEIGCLAGFGHPSHLLSAE
ncbi:hypothetical protein J2128_000322 [Methanomicrobium sp. W14]|jgi:hypothetical protein|uniref:hypothetical protein n=1 Tax=Methanomicrobium sp. W14 TaxID=2817839 RepID=UPI001AE495A5|nr:hypothetical protein [Methanomicrobium sp. W14]MBP2132401.1 hypothetical protein [Methanomicrobium sp. W14]